MAFHKKSSEWRFLSKLCHFPKKVSLFVEGKEWLPATKTSVPGMSQDVVPAYTYSYTFNLRLVCGSSWSGLRLGAPVSVEKSTDPTQVRKSGKFFSWLQRCLKCSKWFWWYPWFWIFSSNCLPFAFRDVPISVRLFFWMSQDDRQKRKIAGNSHGFFLCSRDRSPKVILFCSKKSLILILPWCQFSTACRLASVATCCNPKFFTAGNDSKWYIGVSSWESPGFLKGQVKTQPAINFRGGSSTHHWKVGPSPKGPTNLHPLQGAKAFRRICVFFCWNIREPRKKNGRILFPWNTVVA